MCPFSRIWSSWNSKYQVLRGKSKATYKPFKNIRWYYKIQKWQKFLVELLDAKPYLHKAFRIASASTTAASANASSKEFLPKASAVTFFAKSLPRQQRQLWNLLIMKADMNRWFTVKQYCIPSTSCRQYLGWGSYAFRGDSAGLAQISWKEMTFPLICMSCIPMALKLYTRK